MGVELYALIDHNMDVKELIDFPKIIDSWTEIAQLEGNERNWRPSKWESEVREMFSYKMNENMLVRIWEDWETGTLDLQHEVFDNEIECFFGKIEVYRKSIMVVLWSYNYSSLHDPKIAKIIFELNRFIAKKLNGSRILYLPDSAFPTCCLFEEMQKGKDINEVIQIGVEKFGEPPKPISNGIEYMFFVDDVNSDFGKLKELNWSSNRYWEFKDGRYVLKSGI